MYVERLGHGVWLAWRRKGQQGMSLVFYYHDPMEKTEPDFSQRRTAKGQEATATGCNEGNAVWKYGKKNHCSRTSASLKQGLKGAVQSPAPMVLKTRQDFEQPDLILKLALL